MLYRYGAVGQAGRGSWDGDSLGVGTSMWELKSVKKGGFGGGRDGKVRDGWGALGEGVR